MYPTSFPGLGHGRRAVSGAGSVTAADVGLILDCTGTFALTFAAAATLGNQFQVAFYVTSGTVTLTGNGAETIQSPSGSANTYVLTAGQGAYVSCDGSGLKVVLGAGLAPAPSATIITDTIRAATTSGIVLQNSSGTQVMSVGLTGTGVIFAGAVTANGGTVTIGTVDINGGNIDGTTIGGSSAAAATVTTLSVSGAITHSGTNTASGSTAGRLAYFGGTSGDGAAFELRGSTFAGSPNTGFFRVGGTYVGNWTTTAFTLSSGINLAMSGASTLTTGTGAVSLNGDTTIPSGKTLTVASDTDATTTLGRARIGSPTTDSAFFAHYDFLTSTDFAFKQSNSGNTTFNAVTAGSVFFCIGNATKATLTTSAFTVSSGVALILPTTTPASASATGTAGTITWDSNYLYVCTATDTWKRVAIATWP